MTCHSDVIKTSVTMREAAEMYGLKPNRAGFICCPFHGEHTPSLKLYPNNRGWYCFGCHQGGDVIKFVELYFKCSFIEACKRLNADFSLGLDFDGPREDYKAERKRRSASIEDKREQEDFKRWAQRESNRMCELHMKLFKIMQSGDAENPAFFYALQNVERINRLTELIIEDPVEYYKNYRKEAEQLRQNYLAITI